MVGMFGTEYMRLQRLNTKAIDEEIVSSKKNLFCKSQKEIQNKVVRIDCGKQRF